MQTFIYQLATNHETQELIFKMLPKALGNVPFHQNTACITRFFAENFPMHLAVHEVSPVTAPPKEYTQPHIHEEDDEVNIILSNDLLVYKIQMGSDEYCVSNNGAIWIPRGTVHSANVLKGAGYFITMRMQHL
jgi:mannose-6-phosphate isomerase-like protein (cupin superfamily)